MTRSPSKSSRCGSTSRPFLTTRGSGTISAMADDLQRLFGYHDAVADATELRQLGQEIYIAPFWTPSFCALVVRAAEAVGAFEPQPDDPVPGHEVSLAV